MDATTAQPTLLSAARNFMRKSAGKAALVIAPLAVVSLAPETKAQVIFGTAQTSGAVSSFLSGAFSSSASNFFSTGLTPTNGITGVSFGMNMFADTSGGFAIGRITGYYNSVFSTTSGSLNVNDNIPFDYNFTITPSAGLANISWTLTVDLQDSTQPAAHYSFTGAGSGNISSSTFLTISPVNNANGLPSFNGWSATLQVYFEAPTGGTLDVTMDQNAGQGLAFNAVSAIPEPSTYAALAGLAALSLAIARRLRLASRAA